MADVITPPGICTGATGRRKPAHSLPGLPASPGAALQGGRLGAGPRASRENSLSLPVRARALPQEATPDTCPQGRSGCLLPPLIPCLPVSLPIKSSNHCPVSRKTYALPGGAFGGTSWASFASCARELAPRDPPSVPRWAAHCPPCPGRAGSGILSLRPLPAA